MSAYLSAEGKKTLGLDHRNKSNEKGSRKRGLGGILKGAVTRAENKCLKPDK